MRTEIKRRLFVGIMAFLIGVTALMGIVRVPDFATQPFAMNGMKLPGAVPEKGALPDMPVRATFASNACCICTISDDCLPAMPETGFVRLGSIEEFARPAPLEPKLPDTPPRS